MCVCVCCVSVVEVSGQASLCFLVFEAAGSGGFWAWGRPCFGSILVRVLTSLVKGPWLLTDLQTILVVQETCLPSQTLPVTHTYSHSHTHIHITCRYVSLYVHHNSFNNNYSFICIAFFKRNDKVFNRARQENVH